MMRVRRGRESTTPYVKLWRLEIVAETPAEEKVLARFYLDLRKHGEATLKMNLGEK